MDGIFFNVSYSAHEWQLAKGSRIVERNVFAYGSSSIYARHFNLLLNIHLFEQHHSFLYRACGGMSCQVQFPNKAWSLGIARLLKRCDGKNTLLSGKCYLNYHWLVRQALTMTVLNFISKDEAEPMDELLVSKDISLNGKITYKSSHVCYL